MGKNAWLVLVSAVEVGLAIVSCDADFRELAWELEPFRFALLMAWLLMGGSLGPVVYGLFSAAHLFYFAVLGPFAPFLLGPMLVLHGIQYVMLRRIREHFAMFDPVD